VLLPLGDIVRALKAIINFLIAFKLCDACILFR
jgi:hypothetical protein